MYNHASPKAINEEEKDVLERLNGTKINVVWETIGQWPLYSCIRASFIFSILGSNLGLWITLAASCQPNGVLQIKDWVRYAAVRDRPLPSH